MRRALPLREALLGLCAGGLWLGYAQLPAALYAAAEYVRPTLIVLGCWTVWRLGVLARTWRQRWRWRVSESWRLPASALPLEEGGWWPPRVVRKWQLRRGRLADRGLVLGRAFRWNGKHTQELEEALAQEGALPIADDERGGHPALHAVGRRQERPLVIRWSELVGHTLIGGTTRSGKTRCLEVLIAEAIRAPNAVVIFDPKGDAELLTRCAVEADRAGKPFAFFSPAFPAQSLTVDPLGTCMTPSELSARIQALMPGGGEKRGDPFFSEYPLAIIERVAAVQAALGQAWTLAGLEAPSVLRVRMEALLEQYLRHLGLEAPHLSGLIKAYQQGALPDPLADALIDDLHKPRDHFQKVTANLIPAFRGVTGAPLGPLLSSLPADLTWSRIGDQQMVAYFALSSLLLGDVANRIGRVLLQDFTGFLGRRYAYENVQAATPFTVFVDEFSNVGYPLFVDALNKGGGAGARFVLAMQSLADPEATMGREQAQRVLDNRVICPAPLMSALT